MNRYTIFLKIDSFNYHFTEISQTHVRTIKDCDLVGSELESVNLRSTN